MTYARREPPKFGRREVVRIGDLPEDAAFSRDDFGERLAGRQGFVLDAFPTHDHEGWRIELKVPPVARESGPPLSAILPEPLLDSTGYRLNTGAVRYAYTDEGAVYLDVEARRGGEWEDRLRVEFVTSVLEPGDPEVDPDSDETLGDDAEWAVVDAGFEPILKRASATLCGLVNERYEGEWVWGDDQTPGDPIHGFDFVSCEDDVEAAYDRLTRSVPRGWVHDENWEARPFSVWAKPLASNAWFLAPGIQRAHITCCGYSTPEIRQRRDIAYPGLEDYLGGGVDTEWLPAAITAGFYERTDSDEPDESAFSQYDEAVFRLRQILVLTGIAGVAELDVLLREVRTRGPTMLAAVVAEAQRYDFSPIARSPDVIGILTLLSTGTRDDLTGRTPFNARLERSIAAVLSN